MCTPKKFARDREKNYSAGPRPLQVFLSIGFERRRSSFTENNQNGISGKKRQKSRRLKTQGRKVKANCQRVLVSSTQTHNLICLSECLFLLLPCVHTTHKCQSILPPVCLSVRPTVFLSACLFFKLSLVSLFDCLPIHLSVCLSVPHESVMLAVC